jgi:hypothetical protein
MRRYRWTARHSKILFTISTGGELGARRCAKARWPTRNPALPVQRSSRRLNGWSFPCSSWQSPPPHASRRHASKPRCGKNFAAPSMLPRAAKSDGGLQLLPPRPHFFSRSGSHSVIVACLHRLTSRKLRLSPRTRRCRLVQRRLRQWRIRPSHTGRPLLARGMTWTSRTTRQMQLHLYACPTPMILPRSTAAPSFVSNSHARLWLPSACPSQTQVTRSEFSLI